MTRKRWSAAVGGDVPSSLAIAALLGSLLLRYLTTLAAAQNSTAWLTLSGNAPAIIAKGGFSGVFPDSSYFAYNYLQNFSSSKTIQWCDVQLTSDGYGICLPNIKLDNCTDISALYPNGKSTYLVNGVNTSGWFAVDYNWTDMSSVSPTQAIYSRTYRFDQSGFRVLTVDDLPTFVKPLPGLWLNIQNNIFYSQHNLSMRAYVLSVSKRVIVNYLSSPELDFLRGIAARYRKTPTKLVFRFLSKNTQEPSTGVAYGTLSRNLTFIKTFASGILVPKDYIWPVTDDNYLLPYTSIVDDAHKAGLEIYAADFANDNIISYNYSYDPLAEYLNFIDNGFFSVDGVVSDFPITPSEAIDCFSHSNKISTDDARPARPYIITHNGASGDYADCTDLAYEKAAADGADYIDCPVQVTRDGILICMSSPDLVSITTVTKSRFSDRLSVIPKIKTTTGIYSFNLSWPEIQELEPIISQPDSLYNLKRNPRYKNEGKFKTLSEFLEFAKSRSSLGVLISIENAEFMAESLSFSAVESVISALNAAGYNESAAKQVMIQSTDSSVLEQFRQSTKYKMLYKILKSIGDADSASVIDIKSFAHAVALFDESIYPTTALYTTVETDLVKKFHDANLDVYVYLLRNEFVSQPWDFFSDATVQINAYVKGARVDGIITDFPATAKRYKSSTCSGMSSITPNYMKPVRPGLLLSLITPDALPPALSPMPVLDVSNVTEPPLPPVFPSAIAPAALRNASAAPPPSQRSRGCRTTTRIFSPLLLPLLVYGLLVRANLS